MRLSWRGLGNTDSSVMWCECLQEDSKSRTASRELLLVWYLSAHINTANILVTCKKHLREKVNEFPSFVSLLFISCLSLSQTQLSSSAKLQLPPCSPHMSSSHKEPHLPSSTLKLCPWFSQAFIWKGRVFIWTHEGKWNTEKCISGHLWVSSSKEMRGTSTWRQ